MKVERIKRTIITLIIACSLWTGTTSGATNTYIFDPNQSTVVRSFLYSETYPLSGAFQLIVDVNSGSFDWVNATFSDDPNLQTGDLGELFCMSELVGDVNDTAIEFELPQGHPVRQSYDIQITLTFQNGQVRLTGHRSPLMVGEPGYTLEAIGNDAPMYDLIVTVVSGHGTVKPISGSYYAGTLVTLTATPEAGSYVVRQWTGTDDDTSCALTNTVTMDSDKTVTVEFGLPQHFSVPIQYLQEAIDAAACGDTLIVSAGTYNGDINFNGKNIRVFSMNPDDPNIVALTIIQGTGAGPVVTFSGSESQSCVLDGLTITDGNTTGDGGGICGNGTEATIANCVITNNHADGAGGGVSNCNGTIVGCTITDNTAYSGGGISGFNSPILIEDCLISGNSAIRYGGGVFLEGYAGPGFGGVPQARQCLITENTAGENGGGISSFIDHLVVTNCSFSGNYCKFNGGGMAVGGSNTTVSNCTFSDNSVNAGGGGMWNYYSSPLVVDCIFRGNSANFGGGMENTSSQSSPTLTNCTFIGNTAIRDGGGMRNRYTNTPTLTNCLFSGNLADRHGGGIRNERSSSPTFTNCTFRGNSAENTCGGISNHHDSNPVLTNCILWGNTDNAGMSEDEAAQIQSGTPIINYSCIKGWTGFLGGIGNIGIDPCFVELGYWDPNGTPADANDDFWIDGDNHLLPDSPCIDAGDNTAVPPSLVKDLDGNPRIMNGAVDMGAFEFQGPRNFYVDDDAAGANNGLSWANAFNCLQDALAVAQYGDEIWVAQGIYKPDQGDGIIPGDREATFQLFSGVTVKGGYAGAGTPDPNARDIEEYETILSGDLDGNDIAVNDPYDLRNEPTRAENSYHVVRSTWTDESAVLDGFTVTGGNSNGPYFEYSNGGGMFNDYSSSKVSNCTFIRNNHGGIANFYNNTPTLTNCTFIGNDLGVSNHDSSSTLRNCTFIGNRKGIESYGGITTLTNCIFSGNRWVAFFDYSNSKPILMNCTFSGNTNVIGVDGGAIATLTNCILWGNERLQYDYDGELIINYSCIQGWTGGLGGTGNIDADPCFIDPGYWDLNGTPADANDDFWVDGDYHLLLDSPCIDTGNNTAVPPSVLTDLDGKPRIIGDTVDMGAYEFWGPVYVDDDAQNDPGPGDPQVSDPLENGTEDHPFDTIQEAIDLSVDWYTVLVRQGSYFEPAGGSTVDFLGKNITLKSEDPTDWDIVDNTIIRSYVQFSGTEDTNCKFTGFKIRNLEGAIYGNHTHATISHCNISGNGPCGATVIKDCDGTISNCLITDNTTFFYCGVYPVVFGCNGLIKNCTIANNESGLSVGTATIENCIIYNNTGSQLAVTNGNTVDISYSIVQDGLAGVVGDGHVNWGPGNINTDPCFVRLGYWGMGEPALIEGDYHLRSEGWRWNTEGKSWTYDFVTSRCVDAGNPGSPLRDELMSVPRDPNNVWGINLRINMGAYGGTGQASMPPHDWALLADLNNDGMTNFVDFAYQTQDWLTIAPEQPGDLNRDGVLDTMDLALLAQDWLKRTTFFIPEPDIPDCDCTPPAPVPAIISIQAVSPSSIRMTASEAFDESGVQYYFEALSAGGHDSGWIGVPSYTDVNLVPDTTYCYRVKARDKSDNYNETIWSAQVCAVTAILPDTLPPLPDPMQWDPVVDANGYDGLPREIHMPPYGAFAYGATMRAIDADDQAPVGVPVAEVEYYFECIDESGFNSGWRTVAAYPNEDDRRTYAVLVGPSGLALRFRVKARDASDNLNETDWSITWPAIIAP
ncbi:MAG: right-handed parallel beta-helix repeat-containing protein [Planctomycetota bacterium]